MFSIAPKDLTLWKPPSLLSYISPVLRTQQIFHILLYNILNLTHQTFPHDQQFLSTGHSLYVSSIEKNKINQCLS